jgi:hypothetical protein
MFPDPYSKALACIVQVPVGHVCEVRSHRAPQTGKGPFHLQHVGPGGGIKWATCRQLWEGTQSNTLRWVAVGMGPHAPEKHRSKILAHASNLDRAPLLIVRAEAQLSPEV